MGLFDRFKKNKKATQNHEKIAQKDNLKKYSLEKSNEPTREEVERKADELKKQINEKTLVKISVNGKDIDSRINEKMREKLNQQIDDTVIEKFGTNEEIAELNKRREKEKLEKEEYDRLNKKLQKANKLSFGYSDKAIPLYKEVIEESKDFPNLVSLSYRNLIETYWSLNQFEKAIDTANESIEYKKQHNEDYSYEKEKIEFIKENQFTKKLNSSRSEGRRFFYEGKFSKAFPYFKECIELGDEDYYTYLLMSKLYLRNRDLKSAKETLDLGIERYSKNPYFDESFLHNDHDDGLKDLLENIEHKIETGKFKIDCLPSDESTIFPKIREAKTILKEEDKEKGIELLEEIMSTDPFTNTVYYTLYQTYKKDKKYDDAIRVCDKAIENLGYFSEDRFSKWSEYKNKLIKIKEKELEKDK